MITLIGVMIFVASSYSVEQFIAVDIIKQQGPITTQAIMDLITSYNNAVLQYGNYENAFMHITQPYILQSLPCFAYFKTALFKGDDQQTTNFLCYKMIDVYRIFAEQFLDQ